MQAKSPAVWTVLVGSCLVYSTYMAGGEPVSKLEAEAVRFAAYEEDQSIALAPLPPAPVPTDRLARVWTSGEAPVASQAPVTEPVDLGEAAGTAEAPAEAAPPPGWKIPQPAMLQKWGINMGGWLDQGITWNPDYPPDHFNGPEATNDLANQYQMNQLWLFFVRPTKTDGSGFDVGGRVDLVYGTDWRFGQCVGLETRFDSPNSFYGMVLPQFYGEIAYNNLTVKGGHFATFTSYELVPAPANFFYSHSLLSVGYFDPMLVTGFQADYKLNDRWTLVGGMNNGWQMFEDPTRTPNFLGGVKWASDDKRASLSVMVDLGEQIGFTGTHERTNCIVVYTFRFNDRLWYASQYTFGQEVNGSTITPGQNAAWYGSDQYLFYKMNEKWTAGLRIECVRDEDGARIAGIGGLLGTDMGWQGAPGFGGTFSNLSLGLNWRPHPNFLLRPEARWDWYGGAPNPAGQLPFDHFTSRGQYTAAIDLVTTF